MSIQELAIFPPLTIAASKQDNTEFAAAKQAARDPILQSLEQKFEYGGGGAAPTPPTPPAPPPSDPVKEAKARYYGLTYDGKYYNSPAGLRFSGATRDEYGFVDPSLDRLDHILAHMSPDEFKDIHSVFPEQVKFRDKTYDLKNGDLFRFLDDMWAARNAEGLAVYKHTSRSSKNSSVIYDFNVIVVDAYGRETSQFVRIATTSADDGTVLSAYPATAEDLQKAKTDPSFRRVNPKPKAQPLVSKDQKPIAGEIEMVPDAQRVTLPPTVGPEPKADTDQGEFVTKKDHDEVVAQISKRNPSFAPAWDAKAALESKNTHQLQASADYYNDLIEKLPAGDARAAELIALRDKLQNAADDLNVDPSALTKRNIDRIISGDNKFEIKGLQLRCERARTSSKTKQKKDYYSEIIDRSISRLEALSKVFVFNEESVRAVLERGDFFEIQGMQHMATNRRNAYKADGKKAEEDYYQNVINSCISKNNNCSLTLI